MGKIINMDFGWKFHLGDIDTTLANSHSTSYNACKSGATIGPGGKTWYDRDWRTVDLPHDYFAESTFSSENLISHGYRKRDNAWYRKSFVLDSELEGSELLLCFEGTAVNAEFYFNGSLMARSFSAYTETVFDITDRVYFDGRPNVLAVYIKGLETEGWWYEGAGIYRHVKLYAKHKLHIAHNGIFGKPVLKKSTKNSWNVEVETVLENSNYDVSSAFVRATILDGERVVATSTTAPIECDYASKKAVMQKLSVSRPTRWDVYNPKLYTLKVELLDGDTILDCESVRIGFRTFSVDADKGFFLNDRPIKIKGTCNHQDHAGVGVAIPDSVQYYRIKRLKEMGTNAYRCSHNLPAKEVLDACDELGLIVMDENRRFEGREEVLEYLDIMVRRDRNHPSVIFWSLFNEEPLQNTDEGAKIYRRMRSVVRHLDDSRLITGAINGSMEGAGLEMDVTGINYSIHNVDAMHALHPKQPIIGAENNSAVTTRGCYKSDREVAQVLTNYDEEAVPWGQTVRQTWKFARERDYFAGIFIWTGFDYRGEPTPFEWPSVSSQFGIMDTCGFAKDAFYFNKACFTDKPMVHLLPHWTHTKGDTVRVMAVSNCDEVELFLNGKSLGRKLNDICTDTAEWQVEYERGHIYAKGYRNGKCVAKAEQRTAGIPYAIRLETDDNCIKGDGHDTRVINVCVVDKRGVVLPNADNLIHFEVIGDGYVRGVGNGDPNSHEPDNADYRKLYCGHAQALITANREAESLSVRVYSEGLTDQTVTFDVVTVEEQYYLTDASSNILDGFTMSSVTEERPDATIKLADNDMNSFSPVTLVNHHHQCDFYDGWRIYRVTPNIINTAVYQLNFTYMRSHYTEVYVNGELIDTVTEHLNGKYTTPEFELIGGTKADIRFLMYVRGETKTCGAGLAGLVEIVEKQKNLKNM